MTPSRTEGASAATGDRCSGIGSMATRRLLDELTACYARETGHAVNVLSIGGVHALQRVRDGEAFDFVVLADDAIASLVEAGRVDPASRVTVARSRIALAVPAGALRPRIDTEAALRDTVRKARVIGYSTGPSGVHLLQLLQRWGMTGETGPRLVQTPPGVPVGTLLARGEVELGFQQLGELMHEPGVDVVAVLPAAAQAVAVFSAAVCTASRRVVCTNDFLAFMASPRTSAAKVRLGLEAP